MVNKWPNFLFVDTQILSELKKGFYWVPNVSQLSMDFPGVCFFIIS